MGLFVQRVDGLVTGIYAFVEDLDRVDILKIVKCYDWITASQHY